MFNSARKKLTLFYSLIIASIVVLFSFGIYKGFTQEFDRIIAIQKYRVQNPVEIAPGRFLIPRPIDLDLIEESKHRILIVISIADAVILGATTVAGYFLAGKTLRPIEKMVEDQKQFVADASHELRTPLSALKSEIEVTLRDKKMSIKESRRILESNLEEVNKIQRLTNYLLTLNKYQSNSGTLSFNKLDLKRVAEEAVKTVAAVAKSKNIKIIKDLEEAEINGNEDALTELTIILLDNAIKYSKDGSKVIIKTEKEGNRSIITVSDYGRGIKARDIPHIFDRFYRADVARSKEKIDGFGLGLSIAKNIVELHKGKISVNSTIGQGTSFKVILSNS